MKSLALLKESIVNGGVDNEFKIFKYTDDTFLVDSYIDSICKLFKLEVNYIEDVNKLQLLKDDVFFDFKTYLNIVNIDELSENIIDVDELENCIIKCKSIKKDVESSLTDYIYIFPKLTDWQILDYANIKLKGMDPKAVEWLCNITKYDISRLNQEIDKLGVFEEKDRMKMFMLYNQENGYIDLCDFSVFDLINAIVKKKYKDVSDILKRLDLIDVEPVGLITLLLKQFKNIINIQMGINPTPQSLNMSPKQFNAIRYNCGKFSNEKLIEIYELLNGIDLRLKSGLLDSDKIIDYTICNILK